MKTFTLPCQLDGYRSLQDRTIKITFSTSELTPEQVANIHNALNNPGFLAFNPDPFLAKELEDIEKIKVDFEDSTKTRGQRLRAVLWRNWEKSPEGYGQFNDYYNTKMDILIEHYKNKLDKV